MTRMAWIALTALCCGCGAGANRTAAPQAHHPVVLTLASATEPEPLEAYAQMVERLSAGTLLVRIVSREDNGYPEPERGYIADARAGRIDLGAVSSRAWGDAGAPSFDALNAPLLIDSLALEGAVLRSGIVTPMLRSLHPLGFAGIAVLPGPLRRPLGITRPLIRPVDYRGLRISVTPSRVASATMRAVGATPVDRDYNKPLRRMDALEGHVGTIEINSFDAGGGYLTTNVALAARPVVVFAAARRFTSLTPAQRDILARAGTAI